MESQIRSLNTKVLVLLIVTVIVMLAAIVQVIRDTYPRPIIIERVEQRQEANPEIHVDTPPTGEELHDRRVRDFLNRNTGVNDADELPGTADGDPSPASGDR